MTEKINFTPDEYCGRMYAGLDLIKKRYPEDAAAIDRVRYFMVGKSCLLDRLIYCGEKGPSQTPCPVHKGVWSGIQFGQRTGVEEGCRCYQHKCGCTTGWQPDEHCGCVDD